MNVIGLITKFVLNTVIKMRKNEFCLNFYTGVRNTNFTDIGVSFWSTVESINVTAAEWGIGIKKITLPPGKYIIIAHADIPAGDSVGTLSVNDSVVVQRQQSFYASQVTRRVTSAFVENLTKEKTFRVTIWCNATLTATNCEVMAIRIK